MYDKTYNFHVNLTTEKFTNIAYRLQGSDMHLGKKHSHEGFEIIQACSDKGNVLIKDKVYPLSTGCLYLINAIEPHFTSPDNPGTYVRNKITFSPSYMKDILVQTGYPHLLDPFTNNSVTANYCIVPDQQMSDEFESLFKIMSDEALEKPPAYSTVITAILTKMLVMIYRHLQLNNDMELPRHHHNQTYISSMMNYINSCLTTGFTINEMCNQLHISKYYACHLFKDITGMTIMEYVIERRISEAKKMLLLSDQLISEVAFHSGFSSFSIFSRTFKRLTGLTPNQYRKLHAKV